MTFISQDDELDIPNNAQIDASAYVSPAVAASDANVSSNLSIISQIAPDFGSDSALMMELATSGMSPITLADQGVAALSATQLANWSSDLARLSPSQQRGHWYDMTEQQQQTLINVGYIPPVTLEKPGLLERGLGFVVGAAQAGWNLIPGQQQDWIETGAKSTFGGLLWVGDRVPHLYRSRAQLAPWQRALSEVTGIGAAVAVTAASRGKGGGRGAATTRRVVSSLMGGKGGTLRAGAITLGTKEATSNLVAALSTAPTGFNDYITAFRTTYDGDTSFTVEAQRAAYDMVQSDSMLSLARDIATNITPYDIAGQMASLRDVVDDGDMSLRARNEALDEVAAQYAEEGTPEYQQVRQSLLELMAMPEFRDAVVTLALSKTTFGRDVASMFGLTPGSDSWSRVSGALDGLYLIALDPFNLAGTAVRAGRMARYSLIPKYKGLKIPEGEIGDLQTSLSILYYGTDTTKSNRKIVRWVDELVDAVNNQRYDQAPTNLRPMYLSLIEYMRGTGKLQDTNVVEKLTADVFINEYVKGYDGLAHLVRGVGTRRGVGQVVWQPLTSTSIRGRLRTNAIAFRTAMTEPWQNRQVRQFLTDNDINPETLFGELADQTSIGTEVVPTYLLRNSKIKLTESGGLGFLLGRAFVPLHYYRGPKVGNLLNKISRMSSDNVIDLSTGEGIEEFVSTVSSIFELPRWMEQSYLNTLMNQGSISDRLAVLRSFYDAMFDFTGLKGTEAGQKLYDEFVVRIGDRADDILARSQKYGIGNIDNIIFNDAKNVRGTAAVMPGQLALRIAIPDPKTLLLAKKRSLWFGEIGGIAKASDIVEKTSGVWRVSVVARPGFIPRAVGEEWLAAMFRGELGQWGSGMAARGMARYEAFQEALRLSKYQDPTVLTDEMRRLLNVDKNNRYKYSYSGHLYPLVWMLDSIGGGKIVNHYVDNYQLWFRAKMQNGLGKTDKGKQLFKWFGVEDAGKINESDLLSALAFGGKNSWRRTAATGVSKQLTARARESMKLHVQAMAHGVSGNTQGRLADVREVTGTDIHDVSVDGLPVPRMMDDANFETMNVGNPDYNAGLHWRAHHTINDPNYGDIFDDVLPRIIPVEDPDFDLTEFGEIITAFRRMNLNDQYEALLLTFGKEDQQFGLIADLESRIVRLQRMMNDLEAQGKLGLLSLQFETEIADLQNRIQWVQMFMKGKFDPSTSPASVSSELGNWLSSYAYDQLKLLEDNSQLYGWYTAALGAEFRAASNGTEFYDLALIENAEQLLGVVLNDFTTRPGFKRSVYRGIGPITQDTAYIDDAGNLHLQMFVGDWRAEGGTVALSTSMLPEQAAQYAMKQTGTSSSSAGYGTIYELDLDWMLRNVGMTFDDVMARPAVPFFDAEGRLKVDIPPAARMQPSTPNNELAEIQFLTGWTERTDPDTGEVIKEIVIPAGNWRTFATGEFNQLSNLGTRRSDFVAGRLRNAGVIGYRSDLTTTIGGLLDQLDERDAALLADINKLFENVSNVDISTDPRLADIRNVFNMPWRIRYGFEESRYLQDTPGLMDFKVVLDNDLLRVNGWNNQPLETFDDILNAIDQFVLDTPSAEKEEVVRALAEVLSSFGTFAEDQNLAGVEKFLDTLLGDEYLQYLSPNRIDYDRIRANPVLLTNHIIIASRLRQNNLSPNVIDELFDESQDLMMLKKIAELSSEEPSPLFDVWGDDALLRLKAHRFIDFDSPVRAFIPHVFYGMRGLGTYEPVIAPGVKNVYLTLDEAVDEIRFNGLQSLLRDPRTSASEIVARPQELASDGSLLAGRGRTRMPVKGQKTVFAPTFTTYDMVYGAIFDARNDLGIVGRSTQDVIELATDKIMSSNIAKTASNRLLNDDTYDELSSLVRAYVTGFILKHEDEAGSIALSRLTELAQNGNYTQPMLAVDNIRVVAWLEETLNNMLRPMEGPRGMPNRVLQRVIYRPSDEQIAANTARTNLQRVQDYNMQQLDILDETDEVVELGDVELEQVGSLTSLYSFDDAQFAQFELTSFDGALGDQQDFVSGAYAFTDTNMRAIRSVLATGDQVEYVARAPLARRTEADELVIVQTGEKLNPNIEYFEFNQVNNQTEIGQAVSFNDPNLVEGIVLPTVDQELMWPVVGPLLLDRALRQQGRRLAVRNFTAPDNLPTNAVGADYVELPFARINDVDNVPIGKRPQQIVAPRIVTNTDSLRKGLFKRGASWFFDQTGKALNAVVRDPMFFHAYTARAEVGYKSLLRFMNRFKDDRSADTVIEQVARNFDNPIIRDAELAYGEGRQAAMLAVDDLFVDVEDYLWHQLRDGKITVDQFLAKVEEADFGLLVQMEVDPFEIRAERMRVLQELVDSNPTIKPSPKFLETMQGEVSEAFKAGLRKTDPNEQIVAQNATIVMREFATDILAVRRFKEYVQENAAQAAMNDVLPFIDSHEFKSVYAQQMRNLLPFWYAQENFLKRWVRGGINSGMFGLDQLRKAQLGYMGLRSSGIIVEDDDGTDYVVYPGSAPLNEFMGKTLGWIPGLSGSDLTFFNRARASSLLPGVNDQALDPGVGPLGAIPLNIASFMFPEIEPLRRAVLGDIATSDTYNNKALKILNSVLPRHVTRLLEPFMLTEDATINMNSAMITIISNDLARYEAGEDSDIPTPSSSPGDVQAYLDEVRNKARLAMITNGIMGLFTPGGPQLTVADAENVSQYFTGIGVENADDLLTTSYRDYLGAYGPDEGMDRFLQDFKDWGWDDVINPEALLTSRTETVSGAPLAPTAEAMQFYDDYSELANTYPYGFSWIVPPTKATDKTERYAWGQQFQSELRRRRVPEDVLNAIIFNEAAQVYFTFDDERERVLMNEDLTEDQVKRVNEMYDTAKQAFRAANPAFSDMLQNSDPRVRRQNTIDQIRSLVADPLAPQTETMPAIRKLSETFDVYTAARRVLSQSRSQRAINQLTALKDAYENEVGRIVLLYPELELLWLSVYKPESSL